MINLEWLRTFKTVYEKQSLTRAANALYISQPGVSLHISSLENHINNKLFDRSPRKMIPTEYGHMLYNSILDPIKELQKVEKEFNRNCDKQKTTLNIGMCIETFQLILEPYISNLPFNLIAKFGEYKEMLDLLDKGLLDFIVTPQTNKNTNIEFTPFSKKQPIIIAGKNEDISDLEKLIANNDLIKIEAWLQHQQWFFTSGDTDLIPSFWVNNFKKKPNFRPNYIVPNQCSIIRSIANKTGFSIIDSHLCKNHLKNDQIKAVWKGVNPEEEILYFANRKKTLYQKEINKLKEIFAQEMGVIL